MRHVIATVVLVLAAAFLPAPTRAEDWMKQGDERFLLLGGYFLPLFSTSLSVDNENQGEGGSINLENDLGFTQEVSTGWFGGSWRIGHRHRISVSYFRFVRGASRTAEREITLGDEVYPAGANLDTRFAIQIVPLAYSYSFVRREKLEVAGSLGVHWYVNDFSVDGSVSLGDQDRDAAASAKVSAPLPLVGFMLDYRPGPRWTTGVLIEALVLNIDDEAMAYSGSFINLAGRAHYWLYDRLGAGASFNWFSINADVNGDKWHGNLDYEYLGPQIYLITRF